MKFSKKASMQLSINAIVILVLAMAVLGLGLGIVKGIKGKANEFLDYEVDLSATADATTPIANVPEELDLRANKENLIHISFYNAGTGDSSQCDSEGAELRLDCDGLKKTISDGGSEDVSPDSGFKPFEYVQKKIKIDDGTAGTLNVKIIPNKELIKKSYACSVVVSCGVYDDNRPIDTEEYGLFVNIVA
ncbi:hypothetical protein K9M74_05200 [Candidatus Woesearchaeota archaeon]|nr:hypothetical protein [Candidatus Woesearchaeota archaeon]